MLVYRFIMLPCLAGEKLSLATFCYLKRNMYLLTLVRSLAQNTVFLLAYSPIGPAIHGSFPGSDELRPEVTMIMVPAVLSAAYVTFLAVSWMTCGPIPPTAGVPKGSSEGPWKNPEDKLIHQRVNKVHATKGAEAAAAAAANLAAELPDRSVASVLGRAAAKRAAAARAIALPEAKIVYNAYQVIMNIAMVSFFIFGVLHNVALARATPEGQSLTWFDGIMRLSQPFHIVDGIPQVSGLPGNLAPSGWLRFACWVHYTNKFVEYVDTVFMVAEQRWQQVTFLHTV